MRKKTSKEFGCILTHEQEKFIKDGKTRDNALKAFKAKDGIFNTITRRIE